MPGPLQAVLWDMDGTLIDSEPVWIRAQHSLVRRFGGTWTEADGMTLVGVGMDETVAAMQHAGVTMNPGQILADLEDAVAAEFARHIVWRPGITPLVRALSLAGIPQAIVTTSPRRLAALVNHALADHASMAAVVTGDDVVKAKPDPEGYLLGAELLNVNIAACIAIEDSKTGLAAAQSSGAFTIFVGSAGAADRKPDTTTWPTLAGRTVADLQVEIRPPLRR
jgi:HAD superfamily hydrolase (TIGR01509 family)